MFLGLRLYHRMGISLGLTLGNLYVRLSLCMNKALFIPFHYGKPPLTTLGDFDTLGELYPLDCRAVGKV